MDTSEKIRILLSKKGSSVTITRSGGEVITALVLRVNVDGENSDFSFMDVFEGVERSLSVGEIDNRSVD